MYALLLWDPRCVKTVECEATGGNVATPPYDLHWSEYIVVLEMCVPGLLAGVLLQTYNWTIEHPYIRPSLMVLDEWGFN